MPAEQPSAASESDRFTATPDGQTAADTAVALEEHGFTVEVVDDLDSALKAVLARIPRGSSVMTRILEIHQELPGRIHVVLIRQPAGSWRPGPAAAASAPGQEIR